MLITILAFVLAMMILSIISTAVDMIPDSVWQWIEKKIGWHS